MNRFRPREISVLERLHNNRRLGFREYIAYNWQIRSDWWPAGYKLNHRTIAQQFRVLHYLSAHSPKPVQQRWRTAAKAFEARYFGRPNSKASVRFLNEHTAHRWL
jgi:hypothetical protein